MELTRAKSSLVCLLALAALPAPAQALAPPTTWLRPRPLLHRSPLAGGTKSAGEARRAGEARPAMLAAGSDESRRSERRRARRLKKQKGGEYSEILPVAAPASVTAPVVKEDAPVPPPAEATDELDLTTVSLQPWLDDGASELGASLPSFDDFRSRDKQQPAGSVKIAAAPRTAQGEKTPQEKLMELLAFDSIDERPPDEEPYDLTARLIGRGLPNQAGVYLLPYIQSGHMLLIFVLLLCSFVSYPGFPLTQLPDEYRQLLQIGLLITYAINTACAFYARGIAASKQQPVSFWFAKVLLLGGLALGELTEAVPEAPATKKRSR